jgi:hypothetical protein
MGGMGSGRKPWLHRKTQVEDSISLNVNTLVYEGIVSSASASGIFHWKHPDLSDCIIKYHYCPVFSC